MVKGIAGWGHCLRHRLGPGYESILDSCFVAFGRLVFGRPESVAVAGTWPTP